jgi:hypothetical protein
MRFGILEGCLDNCYFRRNFEWLSFTALIAFLGLSKGLWTRGRLAKSLYSSIKKEFKFCFLGINRFQL